MYNKGDLKLTVGPCIPMQRGDECDRYETDMHQHEVGDTRGKARMYHPCVFLPHSCEEWVVGGPGQIRAMIEDLTEALKTMEVD